MNVGRPSTLLDGHGGACVDLVHQGEGVNTGWQWELTADLSPRRNYILTRAVIATQARGQAWTISESGAYDDLESIYAYCPRVNNGVRC